MAKNVRSVDQRGDQMRKIQQAEIRIFSMLRDTYVPSSAGSLNPGARINRKQQWEVTVSSKPQAQRFCTAFGRQNLGLRKRSSQPSR